MMIEPSTLGFWALAFIAAWTQTLTGFALGLILMGGCGLFGLLPLPQAALVTSILVIVNGAMVLPQARAEVDRQALGWLLLGTIPTLVIGFALLGWLAGQAIWILQLLLGVLIAGAALQLAARPHVLATRSGPAAFVAAGAAGGVLGGLFATAGPPIIWHLYRQPMTLPAIRSTLVAVFAINQMLRLLIAGATTGIPMQAVVAAAGAVPAVLAASTIAKTWPPRLSPMTMRRLAFGLLFLSGVSLILAAMMRAG